MISAFVKRIVTYQISNWYTSSQIKCRKSNYSGGYDPGPPVYHMRIRIPLPPVSHYISFCLPRGPGQNPERNPTPVSQHTVVGSGGIYNIAWVT